jgi:excinuclease UvrABC helicase subunit UvrB
MRKRIDQLRRQMQEAAQRLDFITAAQLRDQMLSLMTTLEEAG